MMLPRSGDQGREPTQLMILVRAGINLFICCFCVITTVRMIIMNTRVVMMLGL